jgi:negative regulator of flagellin synthesis FlgM
MANDISGIGGRMPHEAVDAARAQSGQATQQRMADVGPQAAANPNPGDQLNLSPKASQLQALENQIANLPVVDTQRVQDVQRTIATGSYAAEPARVAAKMLTFEAGLGKAG